MLKKNSIVYARSYIAVVLPLVVYYFQMSPMVPAKRSESDLQDDLSDEEMAPADEEVLVDVPYEYEDVEMVEREVVQEETIEKEIPQVKASYKYEGQGIAVKKGEVGRRMDICRGGGGDVQTLPDPPLL